jgi:hypothetical protein
MDENELRSLRLALRFEAENMLMAQLASLHSMGVGFGMEAPVNRSIDINNPSSINPDNMTYEVDLYLFRKSLATT